MSSVFRVEEKMLKPSTSVLKLLGRTANCVAVLVLSQVVFGQTNGVAPNRQSSSATADMSDLARGNFEHVAASSIQIRQILVSDAGLLVELERWVAKEATDNGQVLQESSLSQQTIFDRLDRDVKFRSVATRLLQRYGYLLPSPNPNSSLGKEEDLLLKERVRSLVQIEAQEDEEARQARKTDNANVDRTNACDPQQGNRCDDRQPRSPSSAPRSNELSKPDTDPGSSPIPLNSSPPSILRPGIVPGEAEQHSLAGGIELAFLSTKLATENPSAARSSESRFSDS